MIAGLALCELAFGNWTDCSRQTMRPTSSGERELVQGRHEGWEGLE